MSLSTVSLSPRWVIPVLYHSYHLCLWLYCISITKMSDTCTLVITVIEYRYHSSWWYWYSTVRDISDNCDRVQVSLILVIVIQYSQRHRWYLWSVSPRWVIPVLYHSYHLCLWLYCISIIKMSDTCTISQLSLMSLTVQYSERHRW
jgi:hypothetical protein